MNDTLFTITIFITLLLIASGVAMVTKWVRVPYTLALVMVGLLISPMHFLPVVHISPELILLIFLPALLFEAAWNLKLAHLRENLAPILMLAVVGVSLSVGIVGLILHFAIGLTWSSALLFGAMISATDPVSVLALFKKLGAPKRLTTIVEGESLFNDGTAVVIFRIILGLVMGGASHSAGGLVLHSLREFIVVVFGGLAVGVAVGIIASVLTSYFDDHLLEITLTTIVAYGSFLLAEGLHVSPVIAVLIAGLIIGNYGRLRGMSPTTQIAVNSFWEYAAFVVNSLVFLLIGLEVHLLVLAENAVAIAWGVLAMLVARAVAVYLLMPVTNRFSEPVPFRWHHVLIWGGLRGSLSMALVLSLPTALAGRAELVAMIFGTVIFSLLAQGLTIAPFLKRLKLGSAEQTMKDYELVQGQLLVEAAALTELNSLWQRRLVTEPLYETLRAELATKQQVLQEHQSKLEASEQAQAQQRCRIRKHLLYEKKAGLTTLLREGLLSDENYQELNENLDHELANLEDELHLQAPAAAEPSSTIEPS
jgi:CPA1 family monovalent cation:H+ antiporter